MKKTTLKKLLALVLTGVFLVGNTMITATGIEQESTVPPSNEIQEEVLETGDTQTEAAHRSSSFGLTEEEQILAGDIDASKRRFIAQAIPPGEYYFNNLYSGQFLRITDTGRVTSSQYEEG